RRRAPCRGEPGAADGDARAACRWTDPSASVPGLRSRVCSGFACGPGGEIAPVGAFRAQTEDVHHVGGIAEAVQGGRALRPLLDVLGLDLHCPPAGAADQVVMVTLRGTGAVQRLALGTL